MVVKDLQPFTIVEDMGFRAFVNKLDPSYVLPSRKALKTMVTEKYNSTKEKTMRDLQKAEFVSLTADMWSSINIDGYIGVTCHYITPEAKMATVVLGVRRFYQTHTAQHLMEAKTLLMSEWGITSKVQCMVTDNASNMILSAQLLNLRHIPCFAHNLNLIVKKALDQTALINEIRQKARKIVGLFRSSCKAKDKLVEMQGLIGRPTLKLIQEVETRWNSTFDMLQHLYEQREPVAAAISSLNSDTALLTSSEYDIIQESLSLLQPFKLATTELSEEQRVSASKLIPLYRMLQHKLVEKKGLAKQDSAVQLGSHLQGLQSRCGGYESFRALALATLLDPRFKIVAFGNPAKGQEAEKHLTLECASLMRSNPPTHEPQWSASGPSSSSTTAAGSQDCLWELFDNRVRESHTTHSATADATVEVKKYLTDAFLPRMEDPLKYWKERAVIFPKLYILAKKYLCMPATSVPSFTLGVAEERDTALSRWIAATLEQTHKVAATAKPVRKMAATTTPCLVIAVSHEPSQVTVNGKEPNQATVDLKEPSDIKVKDCAADCANPSISPNGKTCYSCDEKSCSNILSCSGSEDRCFKATESFGGQSMVLKGCVSKSICDATTSVGDVQGVSCCEGNLCNDAKSVTQSFLFLCCSLLSFILLH
ncbi:zinc finger BED domain-containing protein 4-like [Onychostoma macrolepis]|uniref:zinc finger BED domain-containing protein 4-like n=1 Tax=Onychostoma macrolepis TaxID=369639 RepID=UPI00272D3B99|nr:zinc finger BED domain-containing protein 4-like [Onychostoma macrolepis]